jgi:chromosome segregation ATPase
LISFANIAQLETRITSITAELTFANENVSRLESNIKERDASISTLTTTLLSHTDEAESLREELTTLKVEHSRAFSSQTRALQDLQTQEKDLRSQLEVAVREKAESDIMLGMSKERVGSLMDEVAKLRRTVHEMQQTSAARDVTIVQLRKERERDREDVNGLNIALDSKQQELELVSPPWYLWFRISCDIRSRGRFR